MNYRYYIDLTTKCARDKLLVMFDWWLTHFVPIARHNNLIPGPRLDNEIGLVDVLQVRALKSKHYLYLKSALTEEEMCNVIADYICDSDVMNNKKNIRTKLTFRNLGIDIYKDSIHWKMYKAIKNDKSKKK